MNKCHGTWYQLENICFSKRIQYTLSLNKSSCAGFQTTFDKSQNDHTTRHVQNRKTTLPKNTNPNQHQQVLELVVSNQETYSSNSIPSFQVTVKIAKSFFNHHLNCIFLIFRTLLITTSIFFSLASSYLKQGKKNLPGINCKCESLHPSAPTPAPSRVWQAHLQEGLFLGKWALKPPDDQLGDGPQSALAMLLMRCFVGILFLKMVNGVG